MLDGKVVIITGGSSGLGAALAELLGRQHATIVIAGRRLRLLEVVSNRIRGEGGVCKPVKCDVTKKREAESLIHNTAGEYGRVDILVNNAGRGHFASLEHTTDEVIQNMFAVNTFSLWYSSRPALTYMKRQGSGHIINIASMAGKLGYPYNSAYVAAKHACVGFTHALRQELLETGINATVVCPAGVNTEWAASTEGGSMLPFFSGSGPRIKEIAAERGLRLPPIEGLKSAEAVAERILECIYHPVAEVYTHAGSKEFVVLASQHREEAEQFQLPIVLGERETYLKLHSNRQG